jgi:hypothetical protein
MFGRAKGGLRKPLQEDKRPWDMDLISNPYPMAILLSSAVMSVLGYMIILNLQFSFNGGINIFPSEDIPPIYLDFPKLYAKYRY